MNHLNNEDFCANLCANWSKDGGRKLPDVKHECYAKLSAITYLKVIYTIEIISITCEAGDVWTSWLSHKSVDMSDMFTHYHFSFPV